MTDSRPEFEITDKAARDRAIDPERSCIVQAPAGSGKTTLLAWRYVRLLARVEQPEQILAITFTKKAAAEMRDRVRQELEDPHSVLGQAAMANAHSHNWQLDRYPSRLQIQTIDAFAMSLVKQLPVTSELQQRDIAPHPEECYELAVSRVLRQVHQTSDADLDFGPTVAMLLRDFVGNTQQVFNLLVTMLKRREQWQFLVQNQLSEFDSNSLIAAITEGIELLHRQALGALMSEISLPARHMLLALGQYATDQLSGQTSLGELAEFDQWRFIAENLVLLAKSKLDSPEVRKSVTKTNGFPTGQDNNHKQELLDLLGEFRDQPRYTGMLEALVAIRDLPAANAALLDRDRLTVIGIVLMNCVSELTTLFAERGEVDYNQITIAAITALGTDEAPSDLALSLDYRISHLLIDEFQDTSLAQHRLFSQLIREWTPDDDNTFFAVGDPMQSIYRFRNAEVSLFLAVCNNGINALPLEHLQLSTNFRSTDIMISWFNRVFGSVLGERDDINLGRISYAPASSPRRALDAQPATADILKRLLLSDTTDQQLEQLVQHIEELAAHSSHTDIAILVRNRTPVGALVRALDAANIPWQGTDLNFLGNAAIVSDTVALANALFDPGDRISAFALLRCPLVGLTLNDLHGVALAIDAQLETSIGPNELTSPTAAPLFYLSDETLSQFLSEDGCARVQRLQQAAAPILARRLEYAPRELVEQLWLQLGGPAAYGKHELKHAHRLLDVIESGHPVHFSPARLRRDIAKLYAEDDGHGVQILTVHKSKGLQFKHVLLPHLEAGSQGDDAALLLNRDSASGLLLASRAPGSNPHYEKKHRTLYHWLKLENAQRASNEMRRLLYVAATRAEESLQLFATLAPGKSPAANSLLSCMKEVFSELWADREALEDGSPDERIESPADAEPITIARLPAVLATPTAAGPSVALPARARRGSSRKDKAEVDEPELLFALERRAAILRGNLTHQALCTLTRKLDRSQAGATNTKTDLADHAVAATHELVALETRLWQEQAKALGLAADASEALASTIAQQLLQVANSTLGRWCALLPQADSQAELALTLWENSGPLQLVVDRTFVTKASDATDADSRWIIDYKTAAPDTTGSTETWITGELNQYASQLAGYARAMRAMHPQQAIRTALYFTAIDELWEIGTTAGGASREATIELENGTGAQRVPYND